VTGWYRVHGTGGNKRHSEIRGYLQLLCLLLRVFLHVSVWCSDRLHYVLIVGHLCEVTKHKKVIIHHQEAFCQNNGNQHQHYLLVTEHCELFGIFLNELSSVSVTNLWISASSKSGSPSGTLRPNMRMFPILSCWLRNSQQCSTASSYSLYQQLSEL
jgi:hypothetical protein